MRCRGGDSCGPTGVSTRCARPPHALRPCRVTRRPSLRSESSYGPCGPGWTGASRPSTASRRMRDEQSTGGLGRARSRGAVEAANAGAFWLPHRRQWVVIRKVHRYAVAVVLLRRRRALGVARREHVLSADARPNPTDTRYRASPSSQLNRMASWRSRRRRLRSLPKPGKAYKPEPGLLLLPHLRMRVRAGHHLDRPHRAAAGGVLNVDQRVRQGYALGEHSQADALCRLPSRPLGVTLSLGLARRLAGCREDSAQLCLQTHPADLVALLPKGYAPPKMSTDARGRSGRRPSSCEPAGSA